MKMPSYPFTPEGVQSKLQELYALPNADLKIQATEVKDDLALWVSNNFSLTQNQQAFLGLQDEFVLNAIGGNAAICLLFRLPVEYIAEPPQTNLSKFLREDETPSISSKSDGTFTASGKLVIKTVYE